MAFIVPAGEGGARRAGQLSNPRASLWPSAVSDVKSGRVLFMTRRGGDGRSGLLWAN